MRMIKKTVIRQFVALSSFILIALMLPISAFAMDHVDTELPVSLTIECKYDSHSLDSVAFDIFQVANMDAFCQFSLCPEFSGYSISLEQDSSNDWRALAETLAQYVKRDKLPALVQASTGSDGKVSFADLKVGLYLVFGHRYADGDFTYVPEPFLISLPSLDESDAWIYDVKVNCKGEGFHDLPPTTTVKALKVWKDEGGEQNRPEEIEIQLLQDGNVYETVVLSADNFWRYTWSDLSTEFTWSVIEKTVPRDYTLLISKEGITYVLYNTYAPQFTDLVAEKTWQDHGHESERPTGIQIQLLCDGWVYETVTLNATNQWKHTWTNLEMGHEWKVKEISSFLRYASKVTQSNGKFTIVNTYVPPNNQKPPLPQTGQMWWPIPVLLCAGVLFIVIGFCTRKKRNHDETE